jgi:hypothetical protein
MKDTKVHIEYPDRTKFVSSMKHEQYEEMKTYNDLVVDAGFFAKSCPMVIGHGLCDDCPHSRCWGVTGFPQELDVLEL